MRLLCNDALTSAREGVGDGRPLEEECFIIFGRKWYIVIEIARVFSVPPGGGTIALVPRFLVPGPSLGPWLLHNGRHFLEWFQLRRKFPNAFL